MHPHLFGYNAWYAMWAAAALVGSVVNLFLLRRAGVSLWRAALLLALTPAAAFAGARLAFALESGVPLAQFASANGFRMPGGLLGAAVAFVVLSWVLRVPVLLVLDALSPGVALVLSIGRVGCFLNGCCFGVPTALPWGVVFPQDSDPHSSHRVQGLLGPESTASLPVHPLSLYYALDTLAIMVFLLWLSRRSRYRGEVFLWFVVLRSWSAVALEQLRGFSVGSGINRSGEVELWIALAGSLTLLFVEWARRQRTLQPATA
ncbi:MAG: prolipoprotein diacylglyceryl transferase [Deltaproteobacteria bacterium]|nr:prolipoprotein diacylglyceryl transferase [Deltaproteobacteria bacterium]